MSTFDPEYNDGIAIEYQCKMKENLLHWHLQHYINTLGISHHEKMSRFSVGIVGRLLKASFITLLQFLGIRVMSSLKIHYQIGRTCVPFHI